MVVNNLASHKAPEVEQMIRAAGAERWFLPPYSPDFNPIEKMWSKVKESLRASRARCTEDLYQAVRVGLERVTPEDAIGCFESCGYRYRKT